MVTQNYEQVLNPASHSNKFVAHFYDKFPKKIDPNLKQLMQKGIPYEVLSKDINNQDVKCPPNYQKWLESMQSSPHPDKLYTV